MALVTKNDVTQIFAIQAPEVDLPPTFANYPRGWDAARSNNGKPTIKQFNYIQQRTDQNMLWIHQNGAALPYDATMEYAEGAVTIKDGRFKQRDGTTWINFGQDDSALKSANNLSDVQSKVTARNNLDVMSATEVNTAISNAIPPTTPNATETTAGKAKIATTAIAQAGTNDTDFLTAKKLRNALNATGDAPISACRAWVCFNGKTSPPTILSQNNVSSIVKNATGDYTINFTTPMPTNNYALVAQGATYGASNKVFPVIRANSEEGSPTLKTTAQVRVVCVVAYTSIGLYDMTDISIGVFC